MKKRIISMLLAVVLVIGLLPSPALAAEDNLGSVRVIVENSTATASDTEFWEDGATAWSGVLLDTQVPLDKTSSAYSVVLRALADHGYRYTAEDGYISAIHGLKAGTMSGGWMGTLNDWFTDMYLSYYTVESGKLQDGDEIHMMFTTGFGTDIGCDWNNSDKTLASLAVTGGTLSPAFSGGGKQYEIVLGKGATSLTLLPSAVNKRFQVRVYSGESYNPSDLGFRRGAAIPVKVGDKLQIVVGHPDWPGSKNSTGQATEAAAYTFSVVETATPPSADFASFFTRLSGIATAENDAAYPFTATADGTKLVSTNHTGSTAAYIKLTFQQTAELSFAFEASSELRFDFLSVKHNGTELNGDYSAKANYSGTASGVYRLRVATGDVVEVGYSKDYSGDANDDCIYLHDFSAALPHKVTFHANNGTEERTEQSIFGVANLDANPFSYPGYRFDGWATSADGPAIYPDGALFTIGEDDVDLYAVWTKVWKVTFPQMPAGAAVAVRQGDTVQPADPDGGYTLADGSYTYSASCFGYYPAENLPFTVQGADLAISAGLEPTPRAEVTFAVTPAEAAATVTVTNSEGTDMPREGDGNYLLPLGTYSYVVKATGYRKAVGTLTVSDSSAQTVAIALEVTHVWDGSVKEPSQENGIYQVGNAAELAWLASPAAGSAWKAVLTDTIELGDEDVKNAWTPIGSSSAPFTGELDGAGHTVSGLTIPSGDKIGLFGCIGQGGSVHDLIMTRANVTGTEAVGIVAGQNAGELTGILLEESAVAGKKQVGGIAGQNTGTVTACANQSGTVTQTEYADSGIGGIVGENSGTVSLCWNAAHLLLAHTKTSYAFLGGIAGQNTQGSIESCYNLGEIEKAFYTGGIVGKHGGGTAANCYNAGTMHKSTGAIKGSGSGTVENCYYLDTCGATDTTGIAKTDAELKQAAPLLGSAFQNRAEQYPMLKWQDPNATYRAVFTVTPADAQLTLTQNGAVIAPATVENGVFTYSSLRSGSYHYLVRCDAGDYAPQEGTLTIGRTDCAKTIALSLRRYDVTLTRSPADASVTLLDADGAVQEGSANGADICYQLPNGTYSYMVEKFGYLPQTGTLTVDHAAVSREIHLAQAPGHLLTFVLTPAEATVTLRHDQAGIITPNRDGSYRLPAGTYDYRVQCKGYQSVTGQVTLSDGDVTVPVTLLPRQPWNGQVADSFSGGDGSAEAPYEICSGEELAYLSSLILGSENTTYRNLHYVLTDDIDLGGTVSFTPIGKTGKVFMGVFDGAGHTISNLYISREGEKYTGLFGYCGKATIRNLTLLGANIHGTGNMTAAFSGYLGGTLEGCTLLDSRVSGGSYTGGLLGDTVGGTVTGCAVVNSTVTGDGSVGGLVGRTFSGAQLRDSYFTGSVTGESDCVGGLTGELDGDVENCFARGFVTGKTETGGLVGSALQSSLDDTASSLKNCYADCAVTGSKHVGLLIGLDEHSAYSASRLSNTYYQTGRAGTPVGSGATAGLFTGKTAAEMQTGDFAAALGDAYAWLLTPERFVNDGFPYLKNAYYQIIAPQQLSTPEQPRWDGRTAVWNAVEHASGYEVSLYRADGTLCATAQTTSASANLTEQLGLAGTGSYYFTVCALGDGYDYRRSESAQSGLLESTVSGASVTFALTADGTAFRDGEPVITVRTLGGLEIPFVNGVAHFLPDGSYTYTASATTFADRTGSFTVSGTDLTISGDMHFSPVWDGETTLEPALVDGVYQISNGYELAWYRDAVNATTTGSYTVGAKLTADIDLGGHAWTPIWAFTGTSATTGYNATFDGSGHTISRLFIDTTQQGAGLFGYVYTDGIIRDLTVSGQVLCGQYGGGIVAVLGGGRIEGCVNQVSLRSNLTSGNLFVGGITGYMANYKSKTAYVGDCINHAEISCPGGSYIGGVVGNAGYGSMERCSNTGAVTGLEDTGGVVGNASVPLTACANTGAVSGTDSVGGVAGFANRAVTDCYNTGSVNGTGASKDGVGGVIGHLHSSYGGAISGAYNAGTVTGTEGFTGAIAGTTGIAAQAIMRSYYLTGTCAVAIGEANGTEDQVFERSDSAMRLLAFAAELGGRFATGQRGGYPVLSHESGAKTVTAFAVTPAGAAIVLRSGETVLTPVEGEQTVYLTPDGDYTYEISQAHYDTLTGSFTVSGDSRQIAATLAPETFAVTFQITPEDAQLTVRQDETVFAPVDGVYRLPNGSYTYTVSKFGYLTQEGSFTVDGADLAIPAISLAAAPVYAVTLTPVSDSLTADTPYQIDIAFGGSTVATLTREAPSTQLPSGSYTYCFQAEGFFSREGRFTVADGAYAEEIPVALRTTWDGSTKTKPALVDGVYQIGSAAHLAWFADAVNHAQADLDAVLTADIYLSDELIQNHWTPIGDSSHPYTGTFDGNGNSVYGLDNALFGCNGAGSLVRNLTIFGSRSSVDYTGIGGLCNVSSGSFDRCVSYMDLTATGSQVGGIVGTLSAGGRVTGCANYGQVVSSYTGDSYSTYGTVYLGGIVGYACGSVSECANYGTVTASGDCYGGIGGIAGVLEASTITNCYNLGHITGVRRTAGIVGIASGTITNCYNAGTITCTGSSYNPFCGAIAGSIADSNGLNVGSVENAYYLENSYYYVHGDTVHNGGIGYNQDIGTQAKTAEAMRQPEFVQLLGAAFAADSRGVNQGYPVLSWQVPQAFAITRQPENVQAYPNQNAVFTVETNRNAVTYQWQFSNTQGRTWANSGAASANSATLEVSMMPYRDGQMYRCIVTDAEGTVLISEAATMTLNPNASIEIVKQPTSVTVKSGEMAEFTVEATGENLHYQWQFSNTNGKTWGNSSAEGANTAMLRVPMQAYRNGQMYRCVISNETGKVISEDAVMTLG